MLLGKMRLLVDIDHLQLEAALQALAADAAQVLNRALRARARTRDEEAKPIASWLVRACPAFPHSCPALGRMSRPTSTFSVLERSPMIRLSGDGRRRTKVGIA